MLQVFARILIVFMAAACLIGHAAPVQACAVCFGDPESPMAKGALMGVLTLGAIIVSVLIMVAGTSVFWLHRSIQLSRTGQSESESN